VNPTIYPFRGAAVHLHELCPSPPSPYESLALSVPDPANFWFYYVSIVEGYITFFPASSFFPLEVDPSRVLQFFASTVLNLHPSGRFSRFYSDLELTENSAFPFQSSTRANIRLTTLIGTLSEFSILLAMAPAPSILFVKLMIPVFHNSLAPSFPPGKSELPHHVSSSAFVVFLAHCFDLAITCDNRLGLFYASERFGLHSPLLPPADQVPFSRFPPRTASFQDRVLLTLQTNQRNAPLDFWNGSFRHLLQFPVLVLDTFLPSDVHDFVFRLCLDPTCAS